jgi:Tol biopolymer transport system component
VVGVAVSWVDPIVGNSSRRRLGAIAAGTVLAIGSVTGLAAEAGAGGAKTTRVSVSSSETQANGASEDSSISAHGRFVVFSSSASSLVRGDTNDRRDVFVRDRKTGTTERVSVSSAGRLANRGSGSPAISVDGRFVVFGSEASNLVRGDTNGRRDVFVHDRKTGTTERVSVSSAGRQANRGSGRGSPSISARGRFVAFLSRAGRLVRGDTNRDWDVFVRDRKRDTTTRVSVASSGEQANARSGEPSISTDGRLIVFESLGSLVEADTNGRDDVYMHDRRTGRTSLASVGPRGQALGGGHPSISADGRFIAFQSPGLIPDRKADILVRDRRTEETTAIDVLFGEEHPNENVSRPSISATGRFVAFESYATNLVPGDTNGSLDVFVHDRQRGVTTRLSVSSAGLEGDRESAWPMISADGRFVTFASEARNLVRPDTNRRWDVFVHGPLQ